MPQKNLRHSIFWQKTGIYLIAFVMGGCGLAYEYTFSKVSSDLLGNSVYQWAIVIGIMMFCMGIGADFQKRIGDNALVDRFVFVEVILGITAGSGPLVLLWVFGASRDHFLVFQYGLTAFTGFLIGMEIPLLSRLNQQYAPLLKANLAGILRMDYTGAFFGALVWVFVLPRFFSIISTGFVLGIINNVAAFFCFFMLWKRSRRPGIAMGALSVSTLGLIYLFAMAPDYQFRAEQKLFRNKLIYSETTPYQHIALTEGKSGEIQCYINGNLQFSERDEFIYHELLVHPAMLSHGNAKRVLILGGGDGLAAREVLKYPQVSEIVLVDIDPSMTKLAQTHPRLVALNKGALLQTKLTIQPDTVLLHSEQRVLEKNRAARPFSYYGDSLAMVRVRNIDALAYLQRPNGLFDVVIIDFPDPNVPELAALYSVEFFQLLKKKLLPNATVAIQASSPVYTHTAFSCVGATLKEAGFSIRPYHDNVPSFGEWGFWMGSLVPGAMLASKLPETLKTRYLTAEVLRAAFVFSPFLAPDTTVSATTLMNGSITRLYREEILRYEGR